MEEFKKPATINLEIILNPNKVIMSKTNKDGILEFANDYFVEVSGYEEYELMGKSIYCTQHPDMPEVIFKMMWEKLLKKENFHVLVKNLAKNGKYYWAVSDFAFKIDEDNGEILAIYNRRIEASREAVQFFSKLYKKLKNIETESGVLLSEKYLNGHLEEIGKTFTELLDQYNKNKGFKTKKNAPVISIAPVINTSIDNATSANKVTPTVNSVIPNKPINKIKEEPVEVQKSKEIQQKILETKDLQKKVEKIAKEKVVKIETETSKKSFFQKMFGKTEEELEEERKRKK
jgi:PAS domain S-box-containing protein